jgi:hypothetical protein
MKRVAGDTHTLICTGKCQLLHCVKISYCRCRKCYVVMSTVTKTIETKWALAPVSLYFSPAVAIFPFIQLNLFLFAHISWCGQNSYVYTRVAILLFIHFSYKKHLVTNQISYKRNL